VVKAAQLIGFFHTFDALDEAFPEVNYHSKLVLGAALGGTFMRPRSIVRLVVMAAILVLPRTAFAQEAAVSGTVTDATGGVLPGVVVRAVHEATGNSFEAVTDGSGGYRMLVRIGTYRILAELPGFAPFERTGLQLQVGQQAVVNLQMAPATLQESVTVTGEAPLVDVTSSNLGSNIDSKQIQDLPVNGRNWIDLTMMAAGSRANSVSETPSGSFQLNVDGQQVTQLMSTAFGQPRFSKDTIAEFEVITNRFDARQGRSSGMQENAVTKSGTNTPAGTFSGYFRDDRFNSADFIQKRVLPYANQQLGGTYGGPIWRDRIHYFVNYEGEREPFTAAYSSPYARFNIDHRGTRTEQKGGGRLDFQFSPRTRLVVRSNLSKTWDPFDPRWSGGASLHPSSPSSVPKRSNNFTARFTQVKGNSAVNELSFNYAGFWWQTTPIVEWPNHPQAPKLTRGTPIIQLRGYTIGQAHTRSFQDYRQHDPAIRDDFAYSFTKGGRHDVKLGGEYVHSNAPIFLCAQCGGVLDVQGGAVPANIQDLFPVWNDVSTWNLRALSPIARFYTIAVGNFQVTDRITSIAGWAQDDWAVRPNLTLNLGVRYDVNQGSYGEDILFPPFLEAGRPTDKDNVAPRLGFVYGVNQRTVLRAGWGLFYGGGTHSGNNQRIESGIALTRVQNDGRPDFASNPFNGPIPSYAQVVASATERTLFSAGGGLPAMDSRIPFAHQASIGVQRQLGNSVSIATDFVYSANRGGLTSSDVNLAYNPATGANYPFTDLTKRPYKGWGAVFQNHAVDKSGESKALQVEFTKRMSHNWQASATYLLAADWSYQDAPINAGCKYPLTTPSPGVFTCDVPITLHPVLAPERYLSGAQRHRATFNSIWQIGYGFQLSGLYFFADNGKETPTSGVDVLGVGSSGGRLRRDGTLIARNSFDRSDLHRVDMRLQKRFALTSRVAVDGIVEVFNLFNYENYNVFVTNEAAANYGRPSSDTNIAFRPRTMQFGFRTTF
jgi:hypothetical protein